MTDKVTKPVPVADKKSSDHSSVKRNAIFMGLAVACLGIVSLLYVIKSINEGLVASAADERRETMLAANQESMANHQIQRIGVSAPAKTETATFALG